jgi:alkanesulfonate monooxygenase SsuD/methylene tetrahydromethanopterin reductase-like flavin-dependent oxidoreductase (luciferase family)
MKFALFYEIPVAEPWDAESEHRAYKDTLTQALAGEKFGWDAFWTVEHHFLSEYSHCSNPEILYGAIAAQTTRMRLGYGVRLMPQPYNHPVRTAESVAVLDLISDGRVDFGTGRSATRAELEGFAVDPGQTRAMWQEAIGHVVGCWTNDEYEFSGQFWSMPKRRVLPKPLQKPHPPIWGATTSEDGHRQVGELGLGLCSFAVGISPDEIKAKVDIYRAAVAGCTKRRWAPTCTTRRPPSPWPCARRTASRPWTRPASPSSGTRPREPARSPRWPTGWPSVKQDLGNYSYAADMRKTEDAGLLDLISLEYLMETPACVLGTPEECVETCRLYEEAGIDLLLCLVNPYNVPTRR